MTILNHIPAKMKHAASTRGGEWHGPCPFCGGSDRFRAQPEHDFAACRQCGWQGDAIQLLRDLKGLSFEEAARLTDTTISTDRAPVPHRAPIKTTAPPDRAFQMHAREHTMRCMETLHRPEGQRALDWLRGRGLTDSTIRAACFGYNPCDAFEPAATWGLDGTSVCLQRGITIPWEIDGHMWDVQVRLPKARGRGKYMSRRGRGNGLYFGDWIRSGEPVVLCEGALDAWSVMQATEGRIIAVATGSTAWARRARWIARLLCASVVLVAFDSDEAGEDASRYWTEKLPNARRWRPYWGDVNQMLQDGADVRAWIEAGLDIEVMEAV